MLNRTKRISSQSGFTLVEIAIVLVIIGLLIGGILKGQAMIESAKVKALAKDFEAVATAVNGYQDKFRAIPGDDPNAVVNLGASASVPAVAATTGNGLLDNITWIGAAITAPGVAAVVNTNESSMFWEQARLAGFISGSPTYGTGTNAVGGILGITTNTLHVSFSGGITGSFTVCSSAIPGKLAKQLDKIMDDGDAITGSVVGLSMATSVPAGGPCITAITPAAAYVDTAAYTVCTVF